MKKAFTMIELIFVIVILGILAAVAIPKMMATREDAKAASLANNLATVHDELASYVMSQGTIDSNFSKMSNPIRRYEREGIANVNTENNETTILGCIKYQIIPWTLTKNNITYHEYNLSVTHENNDSSICKMLQQKIKEANYTISGHAVNWN